MLESLYNLLLIDFQAIQIANTMGKSNKAKHYQISSYKSIFFSAIIILIISVITAYYALSLKTVYGDHEDCD